MHFKGSTCDRVLLLIICCCISCGGSAPTFGNEYVHIMLHVPKEAAANAHDNLKQLEHAAAPSLASPAHNVIHHYHHRPRRPHKKVAPHGKRRPHSDALLESFIVSEVKRPGIIETAHVDYLNHANEIADHITISEELPKLKKHVDTYTIVEETKKLQLPPRVETIKVLKSKAPVPPPPQQQFVENIIEIETKDEFNHDAHHSQHDGYYAYHKPIYTETIKVKDVGYQFKSRKPHIDTIKVVESHHVPAPHHNEHYAFVEHDYQYETRPKSSATHYHSYKAPVDDIDYHARPHYYAEQQTNSKLRPESGPRPLQYQHHHDELENYRHQSHQESYEPHLESSYVHNDAGYSPLDELVAPPESANSHYSSYQDAAQPGTGQTAAVDNGYRYAAPTFDANRNVAPSANIDWPKHGGSYSAAETYNGVDSYSAPHVQGVDSGVYQYP